MDDSPQAIAARLTQYVDELLVAREQQNALKVRGRTQLILRALEKLRAAHAKSQLASDLVIRIQRDKMRAKLELPSTFSEYQNRCWDCRKHGHEVIVDKRIDPVCPACGWVRCPQCGACRDPKFGGCDERIFTGSKRGAKHNHRRSGVHASITWKQNDVFPIIVRIIEDAYQQTQSFVKSQEIAARLLQAEDGRNLIETAREQQPDKQSLEWLASNMVSWFSQRITVGESEWSRRFERVKLDGVWAYRPVLAE